MARSTKKLTAVSGRRARITRLDSCGRLVYGDNNVAITNGFTSVKSNTNTSATDAVQVKNANGDLLLNVPATTSFASFGISIDFAEVDPELFSIVTGQRVHYDAFGNPDGITANSKVVASSVAFALEVWMGAPSGTCAVGGTGNYGYVIYPFLGGGVVDDFEISQGLINFTLTNVISKDGNSWGVGPYKVALNSTGTADVLPSPVDPNDHHQLFATSVNPPNATIGSRPQLDPTATAITAIPAPTNTGRAYTFTATPAVAAGVGTWWDFGDNTFDYVTTAGSSDTHTYTAAGTYVVQASTNGTWVTRTITVT